MKHNDNRFPAEEEIDDDFVEETTSADDYIQPETVEVPVADIVTPEGKQEVLQPVTGWLVCAEGEHRGQDFRISGQRMSVGRLETNGVVLYFDASVADEGEAYINYDIKSERFFIVEGRGKNNMRVNGEIVLGHMQLSDYDCIEIGETKLIFRSFCSEEFSW